jgi:hypothetical protein
MPIDDRTSGRSYQLPSLLNLLVEDWPRLRAALAAIDADIVARPTLTEVNQLIGSLIAGSPGALDTLNELAAAMGNDPNFAATLATQLGLKANLADVWTRAEADARYVTGSTQVEMVFIATANQSAFTLTTPVINKPSALVSVGGVIQPGSEYGLNMTGTVLTLSEGVPVGTIVRVLALGIASTTVPPLDSVTEPMLRSGAVTPRVLAQPLSQITEVNATGTAVDFTGIPSWARRVMVSFNGVSTNGNSLVVLRLGAGSIATSGYVATYALVPDAAGGSVRSSRTNSSIIVTGNSVPADNRYGTITLCNCGNNMWIASGVVGTVSFDNVSMVCGGLRLGGILDRLQITTENGTDIFDFGTISLLYE